MRRQRWKANQVETGRGFPCGCSLVQQCECEWRCRLRQCEQRFFEYEHEQRVSSRQQKVKKARKSDNDEKDAAPAWDLENIRSSVRSLLSLTTPSETVKEVENHVRVAIAVSRLHSRQGGKANENGRPQRMKAASKRTEKM